jgi:hypothetical protein
MPFGVFLNPNFTLEEAHAFHKKHHDIALAGLNDLERAHQERLRQADEVNGARIFMAIVEDLQSSPLFREQLGEHFHEREARDAARRNIDGLHELHMSLWSIQMMMVLQ